MRLKDILTEEENNKIEELKMELLDAHNETERNLILVEINDIHEAAKQRYYSMLNGNNEQAATLESNVSAMQIARFAAKTQPVIQ